MGMDAEQPRSRQRRWAAAILSIAVLSGLFGVYRLSDTAPGVAIDLRHFYMHAAALWSQGQPELIYDDTQGRVVGYIHGPAFAALLAAVVRAVGEPAAVMAYQFVLYALYPLLLALLLAMTRPQTRITSSLPLTYRQAVAIVYVASVCTRSAFEVSNVEPFVHLALLAGPAALAWAAARHDARWTTVAVLCAGLTAGVVTAVKVTPVLLLASWLGHGLVAAALRRADEGSRAELKAGVLGFATCVVTLAATPRESAAFASTLARMSGLVATDGLQGVEALRWSLQASVSAVSGWPEPGIRPVVVGCMGLLLVASVCWRSRSLRLLAVLAAIFCVNNFAWSYTWVPSMFFCLVALSRRGARTGALGVAAAATVATVLLTMATVREAGVVVALVSEASGAWRGISNRLGAVVETLPMFGAVAALLLTALAIAGQRGARGLRLGGESDAKPPHRPAAGPSP